MDHMVAYHQAVANPNVRKFVLIMRDQAGEERRIHLTGPKDEEDARKLAKGFRNYELLNVEEVFRGPLKEGQVPPEAFAHGIKKEIQQKRLR